MTLRFSILAALLLIIGCADEPELPESYGRSCEDNADCKDGLSCIGYLEQAFYVPETEMDDYLVCSLPCETSNDCPRLSSACDGGGRHACLDGYCDTEQGCD